MEIIQRFERVYVKSYSRTFRWKDDPNAGFGFDCSENGVLDSKITQTARNNYSFCLANPDKLDDLGIEIREWSYAVPAIGKCHCGREVELSGFTNTCDCGADYNMSGQKLSPRQFWGEETGETPSECY